MIVIDNFHVKIRYTYPYFFICFKSCIGFVLSNCANDKNVYMFSCFSSFVLTNCLNAKKIRLEYEIHNTV